MSLLNKIIRWTYRTRNTLDGRNDSLTPDRCFGRSCVRNASSLTTAKYKINLLIYLQYLCRHTDVIRKVPKASKVTLSVTNRPYIGSLFGALSKQQNRTALPEGRSVGKSMRFRKHCTQLAIKLTGNDNNNNNRILRNTASLLNGFLREATLK